ncbi:MAG: hypothetical protein LBL58_19575 [Tannerellaceae bacterium]|nr:hypothetical protein [Tannerellaceae bacterium]
MHRLDDTSFNIFSLHYTTDVIRAKYKGQVIEAETIIPEKELYELRYIAAKLQNVLMDAQNNINPQKVSLDEWYGYQHIILDLCALILGEYNLKIADENDQTPNDLCREAQTAIKGIVESIRRAQTMTM